MTQLTVAASLMEFGLFVICFNHAEKVVRFARGLIKEKTMAQVLLLQAILCICATICTACHSAFDILSSNVPLEDLALLLFSIVFSLVNSALPPSRNNGTRKIIVLLAEL